MTQRGPGGAATSSVSSPQVQAIMAEQADLRPDMRVLEIGSGGYNAALLAHLVGSAGQVTTVDIDPCVTDRARRLLDATGHSHVRVVQADAEHGVPDHAPYDRILVTAGAWDVPPAWTDQLAPGGRIVVPLRMRGLTRTLALDPTDQRGGRGAGHLIARSTRLFGFVPVQGAGAHPSIAVTVRGGEITVTFDDRPHADPDAVRRTFTGGRVETWTEVRIGRSQPLETLQLWLATVAPGFCTLRVDPDLDTGLITLPRRRSSALAAVVADTVAHLATRPTDDEQVLEYGIHAYGEQARGLADLLSRHLRTWDAEHRRGPGPRISIYPAGTPDRNLVPGHVIEKRHRRVVLSWPAGSTHGQATGW